MKVTWSKNVRDERDCPEQILLGADDTDLCVLLGLACYLESRLSPGEQCHFLFGSTNDNMETDRVNMWYSRTLREVWKQRDSKQLAAQNPGELGLHSLCKFPTTFATENGANQAETEIRGR